MTYVNGLIRLLLGLLYVSWIAGCAAVDSKNERSNTPDSVEIKTLLAKYEHAWNRHDPEDLLRLLHDDFVIFSDRGRRIVYTKKQYAFDLKHIMRRHRFVKVVKPAIWIKGDSATVILHMLVDNRRIRNTFHLIRENDRWYFLDSEF